MSNHLHHHNHHHHHHHHHHSEDHDDAMPGLMLTETPAAMSPPVPATAHPASLPHAGLASDEDEWEDEEDDEDLDGMEQVGSAESRRRWAEGEDVDDDEFARFAFGPGHAYGMAQMRQKAMEEFRKSDRLLALNPYKLSLTLSDLESCVALENAAFGSSSREKIQYRLKQASAFCIGLFTTVDSDSELTNLPTYKTARTTETGSDRRTVLLGHILVTLTNNEKLKEGDLEVPKIADSTVGHKIGGKTIALHSLAVLPEMQNARIGTTLMKTYIQMMQDSKVVDRISLIASEALVPWYENLGFQNEGKSEIEIYGKTWIDMVLEFPDDEDSEIS